jgi:5'-3' exonuclease, N-terminal resolvase-like domain/T4 RNase H, C terminal
MILVDLNQVLLSGIMAQVSGKKNFVWNEDLIRHMVLNVLRGHIRNFKNEYGEVVLCCDNRNYWRRDYFPYYKAGRKKSREKSDLDWHMIFDMLAKFKSELKENFPYKVVDVEGAEADDIIGTLVPRHAPHEKVLIISSDGDFLQLQRYGNVKQYNPAQKKYIKSENPVLELKEKIIRGDRGDGIPNILSASDCFVTETKQKTITSKKLSELLHSDSKQYDTIAQIGYSRNEVLIDLTKIPDDIKNKIINNYEESKPAPKQKLFNYFIEKNLTNLMDTIGEF